MRVLLLIFSIIVAFLSIAFKDTIITTIESLTTDFYNTNTTAFKGLPLLPPLTLYVSNKRANMTIPRAIRKAFLAIEQSEGAGARVRRSIGTPQLRNFSPFLMLDHFKINPGAGFPDHPHRGQETITYLLEGAVDHEDFAGNAGTIEAGDLQFMTAGKGIMHAEMPRQNPDGSANIGMQLWVDLPEKLKKCEPRYRDLRAGEIPNIDIDDGKVHVKIISGQSHGVDSVKELAYTPVWILDIEIKPGGKIVQSLPEGWNAFAYTLTGSTAFGVGKDKTTIGQYHNVVFEQKGDEVNAEVAEDAKENGHFSKSCDFLLSRLRTTQKFVILRQYPSGELSSNIVDGSIDPSDPIPEKNLTKNSPEGLQFLKCLNKSILPPPRLRDFDAESKVLLSGWRKNCQKKKFLVVIPTAFAGNRTRGPSILLRR
jgi:quercetin 2,3-dioxygenase